MSLRVEADFNGLFGRLLCLSHSDSARTEGGDTVTLTENLDVLAFAADVEDGQACFLVARGRVVASPPELCRNGSRWSLRIDERGVRHVVTLDDA